MPLGLLTLSCPLCVGGSSGGLGIFNSIVDVRLIGRRRSVTPLFC